MAVYTHLSDAALKRHLRPFGLGKVVEAKGVSAGTINTIYDVSTTKGRYILRILEDRPQKDARFEEALLLHLTGRGLKVARMQEAAGYGCVISLGPRQQLSVFEYLPGRELGVFEVKPHHARQVGRFLAEMHRATRGLRHRRRSRYDPPRIRTLLARCLEAVDAADERRSDLLKLQRELAHADWSTQLPWGIIHSDLFIDNVRFHRGNLCGVIDFEMASSGPYVYDVAVALCDWAFLKDAFSPERARALIEGYDALRPLSREERASLYPLCCFAAARFATTRFYDFEVRSRPAARRLYKDYRHFTARLDVLLAMGRSGFDADVLEPAVGRSSRDR